MKTTPWRQVHRGAGDPAREARVETLKAAMRHASALAELREHRGFTQSEVATRLQTAQSGISRIERRDDLFLSTLADYVHALGGRLEVAAVFDDERVPLAIGEREADEAATVATV